jgi:hypothetical protein
LALKLPLVSAFVPPCFPNVFQPFDYAILWRDLEEWGELLNWPSDWDSFTILGSGSVSFIDTILSKLKGQHDGILLYASDIVARGQKPQDIMGLLKQLVAVLENHGLNARVVTHADFSSVTSAANVVAVRGIDGDILSVPSTPLRRCLSHVIAPTANTFSQEINALPLLDNPPPAPIMHTATLLHPAGLWDVTRPDLQIGCRSVFKCSGWVWRHLTPHKMLRAYDMPLLMILA